VGKSFQNRTGEYAMKRMSEAELAQRSLQNTLTNSDSAPLIDLGKYSLYHAPGEGESMSIWDFVNFGTICIFLVAIVHAILAIIVSTQRRSLLRKLEGDMRRVVGNESELTTSEINELDADERIASFCQDAMILFKERPELARSKNFTDFQRQKPHEKIARVEKLYNVMRTVIEAYPLLGIIFTLFGLASSLYVEPKSDPPSNGGVVVAHAGASAKTVDVDSVTAKSSRIIDNFGKSITATLLALIFAVIAMVLNAFFFELQFDRLSGHGERVANWLNFAITTSRPLAKDANT